MPTSGMPVQMKAIIKIEKFPDGVTKEQIEQGLVEPLEVVESEDNFLVPEEKAQKILK